MSASITGRVTALLGAAASVALISACSSATPATPAAQTGLASQRSHRRGTRDTGIGPGDAGPGILLLRLHGTGRGIPDRDPGGQDPAYDRVVFQFAGGVPAYRVGYVAAVTHDASGQRVPLPGQANLQIVFNPASGTRQDGTTAYTGPGTLTPFLPTLLQVSSAATSRATCASASA